jgi:hypothetical protein
VAVQPVTANPSIERTSKRLRLLAAAHVELQGLPHLSSKEPPRAASAARFISDFIVLLSTCYFTAHSAAC